MQSSAALFKQCINELEEYYGKQEAQSLAFLLLDNLFSLSRTEILADKKTDQSNKTVLLKKYLDRLNKSEPIQYIIGSTEFYGRMFEVNPAVLIPRPETEELIQLIVSENTNNVSLSVLDIGTGSGCIAVSLKKELPLMNVYALDISSKALETAKKNAEQNKAEITFLEEDILLTETNIPETNLIVSNPPYVMHSEKKQMRENVLSYEPHLALFADNDNPLIFYKAITEKAKKRLLPKGKLYFEINEQFGKETSELLTQAGFVEVKIIKDLNGKDRIVRGEKR